MELLFDGIATTGLPSSPDPLAPLPPPPPADPLLDAGAFRLLMLFSKKEGPDPLPPPMPLGPAPPALFELLPLEPLGPAPDVFDADARPADGAAPTFGPGMF